MYAVSFCTAINSHVALRCQVLPILCCDMRILARALRQMFPWNGLAYNYFLVVYTFLIYCDILFRRI